MTNNAVNPPQYPVPPNTPPQGVPPEGLRPQQPQGYPPQQQAGKGLAITALVLGILALLTAVVPVLGAVLGIGSIVFAVLALKKRQPKGFSVTGLVLGILATITSLIVTFMLILAGSIFGAAVEFMDNADGEVTFEEQFDLADPGADADGGIFAEEVTSEEVGGGFARIPWDAYDVAEAPASTSEGTVEDPHALGTRFALDDQWEVVVNLVDRDAEEHFLALNPDGVPAPDGQRYVLVNITVKSLSSEPKEIQSLDVKYDVPGKLISHRRSGTESPEPVLFRDGMQITGNYTGYLAYLIEDVDGSFLWLSDGTSTTREIVAVE